MVKALVNLFFPKLCNGCNSLLLNNESVICVKCRHGLPYTYHHLINNNEIMSKFYGILPIEQATAMLYFHSKGMAQELIHNLKYRKQEEIGTILGNIYAYELIDSDKIPKVDYIIPTPIHKKRLHERGYNQVTAFCEAMSKELQIPIENEVLFRIKHTKTQTKKSKVKRAEMLSNNFEVKAKEHHVGKHYLLIDDVITSGATIEACAKVLLEIPGSKVSLLAIAYTQ
ncbi:MAG: ComF family protein [Flavobacterium sp.]|jgi:ComF family protein